MTQPSSDPSPRKQTAPTSYRAGIKNWIWRLFTLIGAPLLFFGLLELALRLSGFGYPTHFLLSWSEGGRRTLVQNNQFGWRFFGARMSRAPHPICLLPHKPAGTIRIFVFGESAAFGDPQPRFGLSRMLEATLELRHPGTRFEVVNAAMTGINSHAIVQIAHDCARAEGDVWVVYMGNNEVVGPFGAGTIFGPQVPSLALIRASLALKATRTGQWIDGLIQKLQKAPPGKQEWGGMVMFLDQKVAAEDPRMGQVYNHFDQNLGDIIRAGRERGASVVVSTIGVNLRDCAPFSSLHRPGLSDRQLNEWEEVVHRGVEAQKAENWREAKQQFQAAALIDDTFAELRFRLGQCALALSEPAEANRQFGAARDLDALRFRCDSRLNDIIRQAATNREAERILLADAEHALAVASQNGLPGAEFFYEHVHLTFEGNYVLARAIAERVEKALGQKLPSADGSWPAMADCAQRLAWTDRARQLAYSEILGRLGDPPFSLQIDKAARQERLAAMARKMPPPNSATSLRAAQAASETALVQWPDDALIYEQLAEVNRVEGDYTAAVRAATRSLDLLPSNLQCWMLLGLALAQQQQFAQAAAAFRRVFELDPQDVWGRQNLAICWDKLGRRDEAIREFKRALELKPRFGLAWLGLGRVYEEMGRNHEAARCFDLALVNRIHRADELTTLARFCESRGWWQAAATNYADAIALSPSDPELRLAAAGALSALSRHEEAAQRYAEALQLSPNQAQTHFLRGVELGRLNRPAEAELEFREAARLMPELIEARLNLGIALYQQGKVDLASMEFEQVLQRNPTNSLALRYTQAIREKTARTNAK